MDDYRIGALLMAIDEFFPARGEAVGAEEQVSATYAKGDALYSTSVDSDQRHAVEEYIRSAAWILRQSGIVEMLCVLDEKGTFLQPLLEELQIQYVYASKPEDGPVLGAYRTGLEMICNYWDACFLYPINRPYLRSHTIVSLLRAGVDEKRMVLRPSFRGTAGYPCLIDCGTYNTLLIRDSDDGVESILDCFTQDLMELPDSGSIKVIQTLAQFQDFWQRKVNGERPDPFACTAIWDYCGTSSRMWPHLNMVGDIAYQTALQLQQVGHHIDPELAQAGALLHGIAKGLPDGEWLAAQWLYALGYPAVAEIVACSRDLPEDAIEALDERAVVYWADKLVRHNRSCTVDERYMHELELSADYPDRVLLILQRRSAARTVQRRIFEKLGRVESFAVDDMAPRSRVVEAEFTDGSYVVEGDMNTNVEYEVNENGQGESPFLEVESIAN